MIRPLRFCHLTTFYPPYNFGGDGIGVQRLCRALVRRGHDVTVIHDVDAFDAVSRGQEPSGEVEDDGITVMPLRSRGGTLSPTLTHQTGYPLVHARRLRRMLDRGSFDVIHFHNVSLLGGPGILRFGTGVKLYTAHEHWLVCPSHVLWRHNREPCTGRQCLRCVLRHRRPPQVWRYTGTLDRAARHVDAFIAASEYSRAKHHEFGFLREMEVLPWFLPAAAEDAAPAARVHDRPYFLYVGRLEHPKGLDDVIPVFTEHRDADLVIAGEGEHGPTLRRLAAGNPRVHFLGKVAPAQLDAYYRQAVALIVPSVGSETFGMVIIEAFRAGTPVLARNQGPFPELIVRSGAGELFTTAADLAPALHRLQSRPHLRAEYAGRAREAFEREYAEDVVIPQYLDIVRRAAARRREQKADPIPC